MDIIILDHISLISSHLEKVSNNLNKIEDTLSKLKTLNMKVYIPKCNPINGCREENCNRH